MKTLIELYRWQLFVLGLCLYLVWEKAGWVKAVYDAQINARPLIESTTVAVLALSAVVVIAFTLWSETQGKPRK